ncbi:MAG: undecaprenyldiphospho-muramoylpentapeptide beta-N-acetylglucosaminyltransferase [Candidatus Kapabacteria bacterium]|nr:undecaprenyldiphospho-muramoylpentapeptide beta-N-acetylglucosaminyltransferase [Candidatus Kapabacteria bacterium]
MSDAMRVVVACGGTGGHIFPAVAVVEQLMELTNGNCVPLFLGSRDRMETRLIPSLGYDFEGMPIEGFKGLSLSTLTLPLKILRSILVARRAIRRHKPHAVICTGAYISYPAGVAAALEGVPLIVLESNLNPGKSNARLVDRAAAVVLAFEESRTFYPAAVQPKLHVLGNPVRTQIDTSTTAHDARIWWGLDPNRETVLVFGGSLGARALNTVIENSLEAIGASSWQMIWQTGKGHAVQKPVPDNIRVVEFIDDMGAAFAAADLVVSRSGATTIAELGIVAKPAVLIPLPSASTNEQKHNAQVVARHGAAIMVENDHMRDQLLRTIEVLMNDHDHRRRMAQQMKELGRPNAARDAAKLIISTSSWKGATV